MTGIEGYGGFASGKLNLSLGPGVCLWTTLHAVFGGVAGGSVSLVSWAAPDASFRDVALGRYSEIPQAFTLVSRARQHTNMHQPHLTRS